jgi:hypothetical protein
MILLPVLFACSPANLGGGPMYFPDGERQAWEITGVTTDTGGSEDTGGGGGDTATVSAAPVIVDASADTQQDEASGQWLIAVTLVVEDAQGDLAGGKLFYDLVAGTDTSSKTLTVKDAAVAAVTDAAFDGTKITFFAGPIEPSLTYIVDGIVVRDAAGHESDPAALEVAPAAR